MFLGIDLGTSAIKLLVIDESNSVLAESNISLDVSRPQPLWSEQEPDEWWRALLHRSVTWKENFKSPFP